MKLPSDHSLDTQRCILRYPHRNDSTRFLSAFTSEDFPRFVPLWQIKDLKQVNDWIKSCQERWKTGKGYTWTAERKYDCEVVGQVSLVQLEEASTWSLAFWTHPDCWSQGYATEIAKRIVEFAFGQLPAHKVWAAAAICNPASLRVLKKLGMNYLGENKEGYRINDKPISTKEYALEVGQFDHLKG